MNELSSSSRGVRTIIPRLPVELEANDGPYELSCMENVCWNREPFSHYELGDIPHVGDFDIDELRLLDVGRS